MALYLEPEERELLTSILEQTKSKSWRIDAIKSKLAKDIERVESISNCAHRFHRWEGQKVECVDCGCLQEVVWNSKEEATKL